MIKISCFLHFALSWPHDLKLGLSWKNFLICHHFLFYFSFNCVYRNVALLTIRMSFFFLWVIIVRFDLYFIYIDLYFLLLVSPRVFVIFFETTFLDGWVGIGLARSDFERSQPSLRWIFEAWAWPITYQRLLFWFGLTFLKV